MRQSRAAHTLAADAAAPVLGSLLVVLLPAVDAGSVRSAGSPLGAGIRPALRRFGWFIIGVVAVLGVGIAAAGVAPTLPALLAVMVMLGVVEGASTTYIISWMQRRTDPGMQGPVMSLAILASVGLEPIALAVAGVMAMHDLSLLFWACAIAIELTALLASPSRSVRRV